MDLISKGFKRSSIKVIADLFQQLLKELDCFEYLSYFEKEEIDFPTFLLMEETDFDELDVPFDLRMKLKVQRRKYGEGLEDFIITHFNNEKNKLIEPIKLERIEEQCSPPPTHKKKNSLIQQIVFFDSENFEKRKSFRMIASPFTSSTSSFHQPYKAPLSILNQIHQLISSIHLSQKRAEDVKIFFITIQRVVIEMKSFQL